MAEIAMEADNTFDMVDAVVVVYYKDRRDKKELELE